MPNPELSPESDQTRRVAAQALLAMTPIEIQEISFVEVTDLPSGDVGLRVVIVKKIPKGRKVNIIAGWNLVASKARAVVWPKSIRDEYRRQYDPMPTGSFGVRPTIHPDQVDQWAAERANIADDMLAAADDEAVKADALRDLLRRAAGLLSA